MPINTNPEYAARILVTSEQLEAIGKTIIVDRNGVSHVITDQLDLAEFLALLTPQERADWTINYRFAPILNNTGIIDYTGTVNDLG